MAPLSRSLHCRSQQPTDLTRRYRFWPFPLLDTPVAVAGGRFDTPNRITERPFCEELHGHFWRRPFGLSDSLRLGIAVIASENFGLAQDQDRLRYCGVAAK